MIDAYHPDYVFVLTWIEKGDFFEGLEKEYEWKRIAIISHGGAIKFYLLRIIFYLLILQRICFPSLIYRLIYCISKA